MLTIIVSDIFGKTEALEKLSFLIEKNATIFDPYDGRMFDFKNERLAYEYFSSHVGVALYAEKLKVFVEAQDNPVRLIGFSVGASAIWELSADRRLRNVEMAYCFYGSQIRNSVNVQPMFPISLIFPSMEKHFSVEDLIKALSNTPNVKIRQMPYFHGFMNELSDNFNLEAYKSEIELFS